MSEFQTCEYDADIEAERISRFELSYSEKGLPSTAAFSQLTSGFVCKAGSTQLVTGRRSHHGHAANQTLANSRRFFTFLRIFGHFMALFGVRRGFKMILSHRALTSLNMSSYRAIWTHFKPNFIFFGQKISD